jgi:hypothetical protein
MAHGQTVKHSRPPSSVSWPAFARGSGVARSYHLKGKKWGSTGLVSPHSESALSYFASSSRLWK